MIKNPEVPRQVPETFVDKVSVFGADPEKALQQIQQADLDRFNPEQDTPMANPFERARVHEHTNALLSYLEADQQRQEKHANTLAALRSLRSQLDGQQLYNAPIIGEAARAPGLVATSLAAVGVLHLAQKIVSRNSAEDRPFWVKALATVGVVGLAQWLLSRFGDRPGFGGVGGGSSREESQPKPPAEEKEEPSSSSPENQALPEPQAQLPVPEQRLELPPHDEVIQITADGVVVDGFTFKHNPSQSYQPNQADKKELSHRLANFHRKHPDKTIHFGIQFPDMQDMTDEERDALRTHYYRFMAMLVEVSQKLEVGDKMRFETTSGPTIPVLLQDGSLTIGNQRIDHKVWQAFTTTPNTPEQPWAHYRAADEEMNKLRKNITQVLKAYLAPYESSDDKAVVSILLLNAENAYPPDQGSSFDDYANEEAVAWQALIDVLRNNWLAKYDESFQTKRQYSIIGRSLEMGDEAHHQNN